MGCRHFPYDAEGGRRIALRCKVKGGYIVHAELGDPPTDGRLHTLADWDWRDTTVTRAGSTKIVRGPEAEKAIQLARVEMGRLGPAHPVPLHRQIAKQVSGAFSGRRPGVRMRHTSRVKQQLYRGPAAHLTGFLKALVYADKWGGKRRTRKRHTRRDRRRRTQRTRKRRRR